ncbi:MAG: iron ABC transporter permease [Acidimicrobiales bacterium]|nr:iron ABC transporter permease [Acidimicrobiales bacterium]
MSKTLDDLDSKQAPLADQARLGIGWLSAGLAAVLVAALVSVASGPVGIPFDRVALEVLGRLPLINLDSGLTDSQQAIVWELRAPRMVLGLLVGALLAGSGAAYQGVFRNPLADPFLLGIAAGAGLGATIAIVAGLGDGLGLIDPVPIAAFIGALLAVTTAGTLGMRRGAPMSTTTLILTGVAVASFFTAIQTFIQQRNAENLRQVFAWILGRLSTAGWDEVLLLLPYALVCGLGLVLSVGALDVLAVGDDEAASLGLRPQTVRRVVLVVASLGAAAAVSVSGLIGFVGLIIPHAVRLVAGVSHRRVIPLSFLFGGAFLALTDVAARTVQAPAELPIGVITAFIGAPFFLSILRRQTNS